MYRQSDNEIIITFPKLWDNIKRYWWIFIVSVLAAAIIIFLTLTNENEKMIHAEGETIIYIQPLQEEAVGSDNFSIFMERILRKQTDGEILSLTESVADLMTTQSGTRWVEEKLIEMNVDPEDVRGLQAKVNTSGRMVFCTSEGSDEESVIAFLGAFTAVFAEKMNALLQYDEAVIIQEAESGNLVLKEVSDDDGSVLSVKNVFLVILFLLMAYVAVFLLTMKDTYIRDKKEVSELEDMPVLGRLRNKMPISANSDFILPQFLQKQQIKTAVLVTVEGKRVRQALIGQMCESCNRELGKEAVINAVNIRENSDNLKKTDKADAVVLLISINDDKIGEVKSAVQNLLLLGEKIVGVVYIYS